MKTLIKTYSKSTFLPLLALVLGFNCERELSDDIEITQFPNTPEVFIGWIPDIAI